MADGFNVVAVAMVVRRDVERVTDDDDVRDDVEEQCDNEAVDVVESWRLCVCIFFSMDESSDLRALKVVSDFICKLVSVIIAVDCFVFEFCI